MSENLYTTIGNAASFVKIIMGACNNASWQVCLHAHDRIKTLPAYRMRVKQQFRSALEAFSAYEQELIHGQRNRFFHVADMTAVTRKSYGNITDREYYDFWAGTGNEMYVHTRQLVTTLQHKLDLALTRQGLHYHSELAWGETALLCLKLAVTIWDTTSAVLTNEHGIPAKIVREVFGKFSLHAVHKRWLDALSLLMGDTVVQDEEAHNIALTLDQLQEQWTDIDLIYSLMSDSFEDYDEVFRTKGERKKAQGKLAELRQEIAEETAKQRDQDILDNLRNKQKEP